MSIETQRMEFDAVNELAKAFRVLPPVVDNDYPEMRQVYEAKLRQLIEAMKLNGRFDRNKP